MKPAGIQHFLPSPPHSDWNNNHYLTTGILSPSGTHHSFNNSRAGLKRSSSPILQGSPGRLRGSRNRSFAATGTYSAGERGASSLPALGHGSSCHLEHDSGLHVQKRGNCQGFALFEITGCFQNFPQLLELAGTPKSS